MIQNLSMCPENGKNSLSYVPFFLTLLKCIKNNLGIKGYKSTSYFSAVISWELKIKNDTKSLCKSIIKFGKQSGRKGMGLMFANTHGFDK